MSFSRYALDGDWGNARDLPHAAARFSVDTASAVFVMGSRRRVLLAQARKMLPLTLIVPKPKPKR